MAKPRRDKRNGQQDHQGNPARRYDKPSLHGAVLHEPCARRKRRQHGLASLHRPRSAISHHLQSWSRRCVSRPGSMWPRAMPAAVPLAAPKAFELRPPMDTRVKPTATSFQAGFHQADRVCLCDQPLSPPPCRQVGLTRDAVPVGAGARTEKLHPARGTPSLRCPGFPRAGPWAPFAGCAGSKPQGPAPPTMTKTIGIHPGTTGVSCPVCNIAFL